MMGFEGILPACGLSPQLSPTGGVSQLEQQVNLRSNMVLEQEEGFSQISLLGKDMRRTGNKLVMCHPYVEGTKMPVAHSVEIHRAWVLNKPG